MIKQQAVLLHVVQFLVCSYVLNPSQTIKGTDRHGGLLFEITKVIRDHHTILFLDHNGCSFDKTQARCCNEFMSMITQEIDFLPDQRKN